MKDVIFDSGGDGSGTLYCKNYNYKEVAELFEQWSDDLEMNLTRLNSVEGKYVSFYSDQEGIVIKQMEQPLDKDGNYIYNRTIPVNQDDIMVCI